jgi:hypothetical protein
MADDSVKRFCPFCAMGNYGEDSPYTMWTTYMSGQGMCENDTGSWHKADMSRGKYGHDIGIMNVGGRFVVKRAVFTDDGIIYNGKSHYPEMFKVTIDAMEAEAAAGLFEPSMWIDSFPRRSMKLWARMEDVVRGALADDLPPPLVKIIVDYLWGL